MAALLLTPGNLKALKDALRQSCPDIGSGHASEALAYALDFRTHAALLHTADDQDICHPRLVKWCEIRLKTRLADLTGKDYKFDLRQHVHSLPAPLWRTFRRQDRGAHSTWLRACESRNIPNICLHFGLKHAQLNWDCVSIDSDCDRHARGEAGKQLGQNMYDRFLEHTRHDNTKAYFDGSAFMGSIKRLLPTTAMRLADDFFEMIYAPIHRRELAA